MSKPTDIDVLNELFTGEFDADAEPQDEQDRRISGPTFAESQARLARAISDLTEYVFAAPKEK